MSVTINGTSGLTFNDASTQNTAATGFGFKNRILNGSMVLDQRNAGASVTPTSGQYTLDRWVFSLSQASKFSTQQNAGAVTPPTGFTNYLGITSTSAYSVGASEFFMFTHRIEGFNIADLGWGTANAQPITLSFWIRSSLTGTFGGALTNSADNRSYPFAYTISAANTWEQKTITVAGDTTGTWLTNNGIGIQVRFGFGVGSTLSGTAGSWSGSTFFSATGATSVVGTNGATFYITGVQLEKGSTATSFDYRPYGTELALCQRYYFQQVLGATQTWAYGHTQTTNLVRVTTPCPVAMRAQPSFSSAAINVANYVGYNGSTFVAGGTTMTSISVIEINSNYLVVEASATGVAGVVNAYGYSGVNKYSAEL
jgi:hypothetical protein